MKLHKIVHSAMDIAGGSNQVMYLCNVLLLIMMPKRKFAKEFPFWFPWKYLFYTLTKRTRKLQFVWILRTKNTNSVNQPITTQYTLFKIIIFFPKKSFVFLPWILCIILWFLPRHIWYFSPKILNLLLIIAWLYIVCLFDFC